MKHNKLLLNIKTRNEEEIISLEELVSFMVAKISKVDIEIKKLEEQKECV